MLSYCLKCRKNTENKNIKVVKTKNGRIMLLSIMLLDVQWVIVKKQNLSKCKKLADH